MSDPTMPEPLLPEAEESFSDLLSQYEKSHSRQEDGRQRQLQGTVISVSADSVFLDIGLKVEGVLPLTAFEGGAESVQPGDMFSVSIQGRNEEGYYTLTRFKVAQPKDWGALERAFADKLTISGIVTAVVKGGLSVDVGVRAFMPASRSGAHDAAAMESLVGQTIRCRILKLDVADEDVVVDRRAVLEEEERSTKDRRYAEVREGDVVQGVVRSLTDYGAFVDIGGVDGLLHVGDMAWGRVNKPADVLSVGQQIEAKVLKVDSEKQRIALGLKQLQPHPWDAIAEKYKAGDRVRGVVTRVVEFGGFVELEPGIEGLIHVSEMSWVKRVKKASDLLKPGETVDAVILAINAGERRISLGLKQALGDPWADVPQKFPVGSQIEGPVTSLTKFGAFVQLAEGVEGMVHVSEITAEKRIDHPQNVLKLGQTVKAQVLEIDKEKRQLRLSMKQLVPSSFEEYIAEHSVGDVVTGRLTEVSGENARVELGEGIHATCRMTKASAETEPVSSGGRVDLSSMSAMLSARWKSGPAAPEKKQEP
ncbi:MAG: 30S ribosomal protein S1, partial [Acidobacteriaceae bacterium]